MLRTLQEDNDLGTLRSLIIPTILFASLPFASVIVGQVANPPEARSVVSRAQDDVRHASHFTHGSGKENERFRNSQESLSKLDRSYSKGVFNKDRLDDAIRD